MNYEKLYQAVYDAFLKAFEATGDQYKKLSWFNKNKQKHNTVEDVEKKNNAIINE